MPDEPMTEPDRADCLTPAERAALQRLVDADHWPAGQDQIYGVPREASGVWREF